MSVFKIHIASIQMSISNNLGKLHTFKCLFNSEKLQEFVLTKKWFKVLSKDGTATTRQRGRVVKARD